MASNLKSGSSVPSFPYIDQRLRTIVELGNIQFGFRKGRSTMDPYLHKKFYKKNTKKSKKDLHMVSVDRND